MASARGFQRFATRARGLRALRVAVVHPCDPHSIRGAVAAAEAGIIVPVLVGPVRKIRRAAKAAGVDVSRYASVDAPHSHAAASLAVDLARRRQVEALMKGSLPTHELMQPVVSAAGGLRTEQRMSHVFALQVPKWARTLFITDAALNVQPTLGQKRDIVQNAVDLAHVLGVANPRVAILAAVETVSEQLRSTIDAAALCKMRDRGQITGCVLDGPLAFDNAISSAAAHAKRISSAVAGRADVLVVPDLESGNMLAKELQYLAGAGSAGIVLGASVPVVLTSRADSAESRRVSCLMALLMARAGAGAGAAAG